MHAAGIKARLADRVCDADQRVALGFGGLIRKECGIAVRVKSRHHKARQEPVERQDLFRLAGQESVAAHAGVDLDVHLDDLAACLGDAV